jgi:hypothetical protein
VLVHRSRMHQPVALDTDLFPWQRRRGLGHGRKDGVQPEPGENCAVDTRLKCDGGLCLLLCLPHVAPVFEDVRFILLFRDVFVAREAQL